MFDLKLQLKMLPNQPGVYIMHSKDNTVIYVGKAKILKNRVRQYFQNNKNHTPKVRAMVEKIEWFEYIICNSELEALVLENNLIKKYRPHYNILLKDDKQYPYIRVTMNESYPRFCVARTIKKDGARYFGPYSGMSTVKYTLDTVKKIFKIPTCKKSFPRDIGKDRPCINYQIGKCFAPCSGSVGEAEYREIFERICRFLEGNTGEVIKMLEDKMNEAASNLRFEAAASLRDTIKGLRALSAKQIIVSEDMADRDVINFKCYDNKAFFEVFNIRSGRLLGRVSHIIEDISSLSDEVIMAEFLKRYYTESANVPYETVTGCEAEEADMIEEWLSSLRRKKAHLITPKRGNRVKLLSMLDKNINNDIDDYKISVLKKQAEKNVLEDLEKYASLKKLPQRIESYDISNISGAASVGVMVVFEGGVKKSSQYRNFRIRTVSGQDDYKAMSEVIERRMKRAADEKKLVDEGKLSLSKAKFLPLPSLMLIDGGKGHIHAVKKVLSRFEYDFEVLGMTKNDKHSFSFLTDGENKIELPKNSAPFRLIGSICDETHDFAVSYHTRVRDKKEMLSELSNISGIGEVRRKILLRAFKTMDKIAAASVEDMIAAGIDERSAKAVYEYFN